MTKIKIYKQASFIVGFEMNGHTGYGEQGTDIVCAAISSISQTALLGLEQVVGAKLTISRNDEKGYLSVKIKSKVQECQNILQTMVLGLREVEAQFKKNIKLEE